MGDPRSGTDDPILNEVLRRAESEVRAAIAKFETLDVSSLLEAKIMAELAAGRRTTAELACSIFETDNEKPEYSGYYDRVHRALRVLEGRGYVSRRLFGKEKPYRLTKLAVACLLTLDPGTRRRSWSDYAIFSALITLGAATVALMTGQVAGVLFLTIYSAFLVVVGVAVTRMIQILDEVM